MDICFLLMMETFSFVNQIHFCGAPRIFISEFYSWFWIAKNIKPPLSGDPTRFPPVEWICEICPEYLLVRFFLNIQCKLLLQFLQSLQSVSPCPFELQITDSFLEWKYYQKCFYVCNLNKFVQLNHFYNNGWWDRQE